MSGQIDTVTMRARACGEASHAAGAYAYGIASRLCDDVLALCDEVDRLRTQNSILQDGVGVALGIAEPSRTPTVREAASRVVGAYTVQDAHGNCVINADDVAALREALK